MNSFGQLRPTLGYPWSVTLQSPRLLTIISEFLQLGYQKDARLPMVSRVESVLELTIDPFLSLSFQTVGYRERGNFSSSFNIPSCIEDTLKRAVSIFQSSKIAQPCYATSSLLLRGY